MSLQTRGDPAEKARRERDLDGGDLSALPGGTGAPGLEGRWSPVVMGAAVASLTSGVEWDVGEAVVRPFDGLLVVAAYVLLARAALLGRLPAFPRSGALAVLAAYLGLRSVLALTASPTGVAVTEVIQAVEILVVFGMVYLTTATPAGLRRFSAALVLGLAAICLYTFWYHVSRSEFFSFKRLDEPKLAFGLLLVVLVSLRQERIGLPRWMTARVVICGAVVLVFLSSERKMWVAAAVAVVAVALRNRTAVRRRTLAGILVATSLVLAVGPLVLGGLPEGNRTLRQLQSFGDLPALLDDSSDNDFVSRSNESRIFLIRRGVQTFRENPLVGIGPDQFAEMVGADEDREFLGRSPHNEFLLVAAETGLPGLLLFGGTALATVVSVRRERRFARAGPRPGAVLVLGLGVLGVVVNLFLAGGLLNVVFLIVPMAIAQGGARRAAAWGGDARAAMSSTGALRPSGVPPIRDSTDRRRSARPG